MLSDCVVIFLSVFLLLYFLLKHVLLYLRLHESHVNTTQIGRKTPKKGSYSFLRAVITKIQHILGCRYHYPFGWNAPFLEFCIIFSNKGVLVRLPPWLNCCEQALDFTSSNSTTHLLKILRGTRHSLVFFFSQVRTKASVKHETPTVTHRLSYKISHPDREHTHGKKNHSNLWKWFESHFLFSNLSKSENTSVRNLIVCFTKLKYQEFMVQISQALCFLKEMGYVIELHF